MFHLEQEFDLSECIRVTCAETSKDGAEAIPSGSLAGHAEIYEQRL